MFYLHVLTKKVVQLMVLLVPVMSAAPVFAKDVAIAFEQEQAIKESWAKNSVPHASKEKQVHYQQNAIAESENINSDEKQ